ncbi:MAG: carboxypeptidase-like regulatory domain-containing protein, partial [Vicinamibacterales bacterium]|nr:carboxypeptidase-like regulatory domain-containing protein [Vicinamibacterales bacterium]
MTRTRLASVVVSSVTALFVTGGPGSAHAASPAAAPAPQSTSGPQVSANILRGTVSDDRGRGIVGVLVSAAGEHTAVAVTDGTGRFVFSGLPAGPYLIRVHQRGYVQARAELVQALAGETRVVPIRLMATGTSRLLTAGVSGSDAGALPDPDGHDHGELSWRLRHSPRGALDDVSTAVDPERDETSAFLDALRLPLLPFLSLSGELNLLTSTSLDTPQDLFVNRAAPNGVAYLTLASPAPGGEWR